MPVKEAFVDSKNFCKFTLLKLKSSTCKEKVILSEKSQKFLLRKYHLIEDIYLFRPITPADVDTFSTIRRI